MKKNIPLIISSAIIAVLFVLMQILFVVRQNEIAIVTQLGKPLKSYNEPGLYKKLPWPIQKTYHFDNRLRVIETSYEETLTNNGKNLLVRMYGIWRIAEPVKFLERVGSEDKAETSLDGLIRAYKSAVIGEFDFDAFINLDASKVKYDEMEARILGRVQAEALERYGVEVTSMGIDRIGFPESIRESVFERMKAERKKLSDQYASEGKGESTRIRAKADRESSSLIVEAERKAKDLKGDADAAAVESYKAFEEDPELANFIRNLEALEEILKEKSTVILDAKSAPFKLLNSEEEANNGK